MQQQFQTLASALVMLKSLSLLHCCFIKPCLHVVTVAATVGTTCCADSCAVPVFTAY